MTSQVNQNVDLVSADTLCNLRIMVTGPSQNC